MSHSIAEIGSLFFKKKNNTFLPPILGNINRRNMGREEENTCIYFLKSCHFPLQHNHKADFWRHPKQVCSEVSSIVVNMVHSGVILNILAGTHKLTLVLQVYTYVEKLYEDSCTHSLAQEPPAALPKSSPMWHMSHISGKVYKVLVWEGL